jgi:hypothetical protein
MILWTNLMLVSETVFRWHYSQYRALMVSYRALLHVDHDVVGARRIIPPPGIEGDCFMQTPPKSQRTVHVPA